MVLENGDRWTADWEFKGGPKAQNRPSRVIRAARLAMTAGKVKGRSKWRRYTITIENPRG